MQDSTSIVPAGSARFALAALSQAAEGLTNTPFPSKIVMVDECELFGTQFIDGADEAAAKLSAKDELKLVREPENRQNDSAVAAYVGKQKLGYLPWDIDDIPARLMDGGKRVGATVLSVGVRRAQHVVKVEVYLDD